MGQTPRPIRSLGALFPALMLFFLFWAVPAAIGGSGPPAPAALPLDAAGHLQISPSDRCPVCAMRVADHSKFASAIELADGRSFYFCGTGCMIRSWMNPDVFLGVAKTALKRSVVRDYFSGDFIDGTAAVWVAGSDVMGPMGPALVPLRTEADSDAFRKRHGGKTVFRLNEMTNSQWERMTGKKAAP